MKPVKPSIGGQAVIEGVMMRGLRSTAIAVRTGDGIVVKTDENKSLSDKYKILKLPILRGILALIEMMILGIQSLSYSAYMSGEDDEEQLTSKDMAIALLAALGFALLLFVVIPTAAARLIGGSIKSPVVLNAFEGMLRIVVFLIYIISISRMKDIRRVFEYHGAEHKTVHCYENDENLTVENVKKYSVIHPRCGTGFIMVVMAVSVLLFSFLGWRGIVQRIVSRILLMPLVSGISYEFIRLAGKSKSPIVSALNAPGMMLQKFTTREPDEAQIEVAIAAISKVL